MNDIDCSLPLTEIETDDADDRLCTLLNDDRLPVLALLGRLACVAAKTFKRLAQISRTAFRDVAERKRRRQKEAAKKKKGEANNAARRQTGTADIQDFLVNPLDARYCTG